ncbi:alpha-N-methyltransferase NTM1 [Pseudomassariella vexata]|uniref:Alpha N-terminal protein methyltransferase 1 n=1 Tax=Pseudomassariella vexata TaxID=1141098 RepID=A0A1Y2EDD8_9PEZI|nr:alpha-N-methyltransferase NTM1 [Pseudomassariella vexata]ORY69572.1 alpha-N-methyltransferase NTM1 [Pseudomassariella vexata]
MSESKNKDGPTPDSKIRTDDSRQYWESVDADENGMLGGFQAISKVDLRGSRAFLAKLGFGKTSTLRKVRRAVDGGAGIGRITKNLLIDVSDTVDIVEPIAKFTAELKDVSGVGHVFNVGLEEWQPMEGVSYDIIWNQWVVGHLTDAQLIKYLERCKEALSRDEETGRTIGLIVLKENLTRTNEDLFDETDSSVTRHDGSFKRLFAAAGLKIVRTELQNGLPKQIFPVRMYALRPKDS